MSAQQDASVMPRKLTGRPFKPGPDPRRQGKRLTLPSMLRKLGAKGAAGGLDRAAEAFWRVAANEDHPHWVEVIRIVLDRFDGPLQSSSGRHGSSGIQLAVVHNAAPNSPDRPSEPVPVLTVSVSRPEEPEGPGEHPAQLP